MEQMVKAVLVDAKLNGVCEQSVISAFKELREEVQKDPGVA